MGRTRKTIVAISAGLVGVLIMAGVAAASRGGGPGPIAPQQVLPALDSTSATSATSETSSTSAESSSVPQTTIASGVTTATEPEHANPEPGDDNGQDAADDNGDDTSTSIPDHTSTSVPDETSTTLAPINDGVRSFTVAGGTVVVDIEGHSLTLVSVTPNAGVDVKDQRAEADRVEVEFRGPDGDSRVRVRIDNGRLRVETRDN